MNALASPSRQGRLPIVVIGVSGSGKSTVAIGIASALSLQSIDGDAFHLPQSVAKMAAGTPLTDADRWPWLDRIEQNSRMMMPTRAGSSWPAQRSGGAIAIGCARRRPACGSSSSTGRPL